MKYEISELLSVSATLKMMHELGSILRHHIEDEYKNDENFTMHRNVTTQNNFNTGKYR